MIDTAAPLVERVDDEFLDLACADDDWLRAEFDAIIAASWPESEVPDRGRGGADRRDWFGEPRLLALGDRGGSDCTVPAVVVEDAPARNRAPPG